MSTSAWFAHRLEAVCVKLDLPVSVLSLLGALGANIPNYVASIVAIVGGQLDVGLGIIIGSNIYNVAIILSISTFATAERQGLLLASKQVHDVRTVAGYTLAIMLTTLLLVWLLPGTPLIIAGQSSFLMLFLMIVVATLILAIFCFLVIHALRRVHHTHDFENGASTPGNIPSLPRSIVEALLALAIALGGVIVMVQSGQTFTSELHIPSVLAGLLVLAVATSLPNTVVAFSLARDGQASACVEEIFTNNSINAALGIAVPLLFWHDVVHDRLLLLLDMPLVVLLTSGALVCILRRRVSHAVALFLLLSYVVWVVVHVFV